MKNIQLFEDFLNEEGKIKFKQWTGVIEKGEYSNGRTALELIDPKNGESILVATVNIPEEEIEKDEVIIKNYSENEGILPVLVKAGVIGEPIRTVQAGFTKAYVCKLLV